MTVRVHRSEQSRHLVLRLSAGEVLPGALTAKLGEERVACGWLRASGVLADVELRAFDPQAGGWGRARRIAGPLHLLALEGSVGLTDGEPGVSLRAVLARETDRGLETLAGEILGARTVALEVLVTVLEDLSLERALDETAGVWMLDSATPAPPNVPVTAVVTAPLTATSVAAPRSVPSAPATRQAPGPASNAPWSTALEASAQANRDPTGHARYTTATVQIPQRPTRAQEVEIDAPVPEPGDVVDHFAFGRCDVVKSDGDRLHLRVHKDGRIREIALEMLRVTPLEGDVAGSRFKLERRNLSPRHA